MRLGELLNHKDLDLRLLHDPGEATSIEFGRVFTTDLPDPTRYLFGGELVLSGLVFHSGDAAESEAFVAALVRNAVVALGAGAERFGHIPDHVVDACARHGLALFAVPEHMSFSRVTDVVVASHADSRVGEMTASLTRHRELLDAVASGRALDDMAVELRAATGIDCWIITPTGRQVVAVTTGRHALPGDAVDELTAGALRANVFPIAVGEYTVVRVGSSGARRGTGEWFLVINRHLAELSDDLMGAFREFAAVSALVRARELDVLPAVNRAADRVVVALVSQAPPGEVRAAFDDAGLADGREWIVLSAAIEDRRDLNPLVRASLRDVLIEFGYAAVGEAPDAEVIAVVDAGVGPRNLEQVLAERLARLVPILPGTLTVGMSEPSSSGWLTGALQIARYARTSSRRGGVDTGRDGDRPAAVVIAGSEQLSSARTMFATLPDDARRLFVSRVLTPVTDHDAHNGTDLLHTLRIFLDENGSWSRTANRMHLHTNTVRYRISRVEELTGRDLATTADRTDLYLAIAAMGRWR